MCTARTWRSLAVVMVLSCSTAASAQSGIQYVYDELGRLLAVVDAAGDAAVYRYDAVGNLLAIERYSSSTVSIISFTPAIGPVGTTVTIVGTGFSATPSQNSVTFNGTAAAITSATTTTLVVTVPAGATTGTIAVSAPAGSATSASPFTVASTPGAPTITSFTPGIGVSGTSVTLTGTNFDTTPSNDRVLFNGLGGASVSSASATSLTTAVSSIATSGRLTVATPAGAGSSASDFFVPPSPYVASDVVSTGRATLGSALAVPIGTANKVGLVVVDATIAHRLSLKIVPGPISTVTIYKPNGAFLASAAVGIFTTLIEPQTLPATGTYAVLVDPAGSATGTTTLRPYDVPPDLSGTITPGGSAVGVTLSTPGQNGLYTVGTPANSRVSLRVSSGPLGTVTVRNPDGSTVTSGSITVVPTFIEPWSFASGQTIKVDPSAANTGTVTLTAYDVPPDVTGTLTIGGGLVGVTTTAPGQNGSLTFAGTASQQVTVHVTSNGMGTVTVKLLSPTGSVLTSTTTSAASFNLSPVTLSTTGTYTVVVDPSTTNTGSLNVSVTTP